MPVLLARSFVYELAVFRALLKSVGSVCPEVSDQVVTALERLDQDVPDLVGVRDSLAHLEDRTLGEVRGKPIAWEEEEPSALLTVGKGVISAPMGSGRLGVVSLSAGTVRSCEAALEAVIRAFPKKAGFDAALVNLRKNIPKG